MHSLVIYCTLIFLLFICLALTSYYEASEPQPRTNYNLDFLLNALQDIKERVTTREESEHVDYAETRHRVMLPMNYEEPGFDMDVCRTPPELWEAEELPMYLKEAGQTDGELIHIIKHKWVLAPDTRPLNLDHPEFTYFAQSGQDRALDWFFHNKTGGFYIEIGAFDGETLSGTLYFERRRKWQGLLVEPDAASFEKLLLKHRNAYMLNACVSPGSQAGVMNFTSIKSHPQLSRLEADFQHNIDALRTVAGDTEFETSHVQCFPLFSITEALDSRHVDMLRISIGGSMFKILKSIPFDKVDIGFILIDSKNEGPREMILERVMELFEPYGYRSVELKGNNVDIGITKL